jgi:PAS domain S-box-containing protein
MTNGKLRSRKRTAPGSAATRPPRSERSKSRPPVSNAAETEEIRRAHQELDAAKRKLRRQKMLLASARLDLEGERQRYRDFFEFAPGAYLVTDLHGSIREANEAARELLHLPHGYLIGKPLAGYVARQEARFFRVQLHQLAQSDGIVTWETKMGRRGGTEFDGEITAAPVRNARGEVTSLRWVLRDISERKRAEAQIQALDAELERRVVERTAQLDASDRVRSDLTLRLTSEADILQAIMENTHAQLAFLDPQFDFVLVNAAYAKGSGHSREELIGRNHFDLFPNVDTQAIFERARDRGERVEFFARPFEYADQPERGVTFWNWSCVPVKNATGQVQGLVLSLLDVTETAKAQQEEQSHAHKMVAILESITDSYIALDHEWRFSDVNPVAERTILRRPKRELLGQVIWEAYPQSVGGALHHHCLIAAAKQQPVHFEAELALNGQWYEVHVYPTREGLSLYLRDIEGRRREQEANSRLAAIVESSEDAIISINPEGVISNWNPAAERLFGYSGQEIIGKPLSLLYPSDHRDEFPQIMQRLERGERIDHYETERMRKDGVRIQVALSISAIKDSAGRIIGAAKIARDITAQKRAREAEHFLAEASAILASSLDYEATLPSVAQLALPFLADYCVIDINQEDGSLRRVTAAAAAPPRQELLAALMARYPPGSEAMGARQVVQSGLPRVLWEMPATVSQEVADDPELMRFLRDLAPRSYMIVPMIARGRTLGAISLGLAEGSRRYDATDLAVAEDLARRAAYAVDNARLYYDSQAAVSARDQFLALASHEVRTPLTVIQGYTQLLLQEAQDSPNYPGTKDGKFLRGLRNIEYSARRLEALMTDLMDITRLSGGRLTISAERLNLSELLLKVIEAVKAQKELLLHSGRLNLHVEIRKDEVWGEWDRVRLEQVLTNLVNNAVKYSSPDGKIQVRLDVEGENAQVGRHWAHLVVSDDGIGIPPADLGKIFQPFVRATNAVERQYPGLGVGLAVSRAIIVGHGGCIWVESEGVDRGSSFHIILPMQE